MNDVHRDAERGEAVAAATASRSAALRAYLGGRLERWQRWLVGAVGAALLPVMFLPVLPIWKIFLVAPQYREGLQMLIFVNDLQGDLKNINILNHYIGMQEISAGSFPEFGYLPWALTLFGGVALLAAIVDRRWLAFLGWAGFAAFGTVMMMHFADWMVEYGTNLDPKAALDFGAFTPPMLGTVHRGNFVVTSYPHWGGVILIGAGLLGPLVAASDFWRARRRGGIANLMIAALLTTAAVSGARAEEFISYAEPSTVSALQGLIAGAADGDEIVLPEGVHKGQLIVDRSLTLTGSPATILDGEGRGTVVIVRAPGVTLRGFTVRNSGWELLLDDAGVLIDEADSVTVEDLVLEDNNHGVYVRNARGPVIRNCRITGRRGRVQQENHGNGIHVWYAIDTLVSGNVVSGHRDWIYLSFAETARVTGNVFMEEDRFGLHSMYSQRNILKDNAFTRNTAGVALMFSNRMRMEGNLFIHNRGHRTYGLLLRDCSDSLFLHNRLVDNTIALFLDGSNRNRFEENLVAENGWGVIAYSSSEDNVFTRNAFLSNDYQMSLDMRRTRNLLYDDGVGNYWDDARAYDLDGDGIGDAPHHPVSLFAFVSKQSPDLTVFAGSPAVLALDLAQQTLPVLQLTDLVDPAPMLRPVTVPPYAGPQIPEGSERSDGRRLPTALVSLVTACGGLVLLKDRR